jgi:hypothetical protein
MLKPSQRALSMHINKAIKSVHSIIRGTLERHHRSIVVTNVLEQGTQECLAKLKQDYDRVAHVTGKSTIWPKMILRYELDEDDTPIPVFSPIKDSRGFVLGMKVQRKDLPDRPVSTKVYLEWFAPEI